MIDLAFRGLEDADGVVDETWVNSVDVSMEFSHYPIPLYLVVEPFSGC